MSLIKANKDNFKQIISSDKKVLVDFYADWCGPCQMVSPFVEQIANEHPEYVIAKVNVDEEPELAAQYDVRGIPLLMVFENGEVKKQAAGARPKQAILDLIEG
ncbi:MAG: thioredoxin [Clostridia bacterium]|nr:thioredoxin [Clostridia bacterium]